MIENEIYIYICLKYEIIMIENEIYIYICLKYEIIMIENEIYIYICLKCEIIRIENEIFNVALFTKDMNARIKSNVCFFCVCVGGDEFFYLITPYGIFFTPLYYTDNLQQYFVGFFFVPLSFKNMFKQFTIPHCLYIIVYGFSNNSDYNIYLFRKSYHFAYLKVK